jgi:H+/Cl- antiporter ClcA
MRPRSASSFAGMSEPQRPSLTERARALASALLERVRQSVANSRAKDFILLALPYQISAVLTALIAVGYAWLFNWMGDRNAEFIAIDRRLIFLSAPLSFGIAWWLVYRFAPLAGGSGIPQLMAAVEVATEKKRDKSARFLNMRILIVKVMSSLALVVGGGAVGREGPTLQIAGSIYRTVHRLLPPFWPKVSRRIMMITGGAAGLSAAFNTPLGGIVFAVEELTKTHIAQFRTAVLTAVILSGMTAQSLLGPYLLLGYPKLAPATVSFMYKILFLSVIAGGIGALFCRGLIALDKLRRGLQGALANGLFALACSLLFAAVVYFIGNSALGSGHLLLEDHLFGDQPDTGAHNVAARVLGSLFSFSAGGAGGIFAPSLASGAAIGGWLTDALGLAGNRGQFNLLVLAGMTAFLSGVTRSPFTSAILVLEMTDRHSAIFQLMYASVAGYMIAFVIDRKSYYERMKERLLRAMPDWKPEEEAAPEPSPEPRVFDRR